MVFLKATCTLCWVGFIVIMQSWRRQEATLLFQHFLCSIITKTRKKKPQRISDNRTPEYLLARNAAKGECRGFLGIEVPSTILNSCISWTWTVDNAQGIVHNFLTFTLSSEFSLGTCEMQESFFCIFSEWNFWWEVGIMAFSDLNKASFKMGFSPPEILGAKSIWVFLFVCFRKSGSNVEGYHLGWNACWCPGPRKIWPSGQACPLELDEKAGLRRASRGF